MYRTFLKKWQTIDFFIKKTYDLKEYCQITVVLSTLLANYIYFNSANLNDLHITGIVLVLATPKGLNGVLKRFLKVEIRYIYIKIYRSGQIGFLVKNQILIFSLREGIKKLRKV